MRTLSHTSAAILSSLIMLISPASTLAADAGSASAKTEDGGWVTLFNGKDLQGWQDAHGSQEDPRWTAENGTMTNNKDGARDIATIAGYKDFELTLEYRTVKHGNSGVYLRGRTEVQVYDSFGKAAPTPEDDGAIYGQFAPKVNASKPAGEWSALEVRLVGDTLTVKLNGQVIHDSVKLTKVCGGALPGGLLDPGPIRLQGDHGKVWYRNLKLRPITADDKAKQN